MSLDSAYAARPLPYFYSIPSEPHTGVHEHAWVSPFSSAPCLPNVHALSDSNPQPPFLIIKKGPKWDPSSKSYWRRAGDSNPRCPFGAYSLSRRAPSASRSALRNSRSIVTKQPRMGKRKFSNCLASFPPWRLRLPQRAVEGAELVVAHGAPHLEDATACQEKEAVVDQLHSGICQLIRHGGHWRQL